MKLTGKDSASRDQSRPSHRTALVTGGTGGIGFHIAAGLARTGIHVLVTGRNPATGHEAVEQLRQKAGHNGVELLLADASLVRENVRLAELVRGRFGQLDVLVNNVGGGGFAQRLETAEGTEATLALNFVGPFALTTHLLPLLASASSARIVNIVSSAFGMWKRDPFDDLNAQQRYVGIEAYAHAKLLNVLASLALSRHLASSTIAVNLVNPGMAWTAGVAALTPEAVPQWRFVWPIVRWFQRRASAEDAARGPVYVATAGEEIDSGLYFEGMKERALPAHVMDTTAQDRAWRLAQSLMAKALPESSRTGVL